MNAAEYVEVEDDGVIKERESSYVNEGSDNEPEEDLQWIPELKNADPEKFEKETYYTFINDGRTIKKGEQVCYRYGRRTNLSLMITYGFCIQDNIYDSVRCRFRLDIAFEEVNWIPDITDMICYTNSQDSKSMQEIRFKRYAFNDKLMAYIRGCFRSDREAWTDTIRWMKDRGAYKVQNRK